MGGMRPSGLHINKPAVIGIVVLFAGCFVVYKYMWSGTSVSSFSKEASPFEEDKKTVVEDKPKLLNVKTESTGAKSETAQPIVWKLEDLENPPELSDEMKANLERKNDSIFLTIDGKNYKSFVQIAIQKGSNPKLSVLLLHGARFTSQNWINIGVLDNVASWGFRAVAVDLPGYGQSEIIDQSLHGSYLPALIAALQVEKPAIVSPSMSGKFSLPFLFGDPQKSMEKASGFVPVAPVGVNEYESAYSKSQIPTLIVYGTKDSSLGIPGAQVLQQLPKSITAPISEAGHACYLDKPKDFIKFFYSFLRRLSV